MAPPAARAGRKRDAADHRGARRASGARARVGVRRDPREPAPPRRVRGRRRRARPSLSQPCARARGRRPRGATPDGVRCGGRAGRLRPDRNHRAHDRARRAGWLRMELRLGDLLQGDELAHQTTTPARAPRTEPFPDGVEPKVLEALERQGITQLYLNQAEAWADVRLGDNVIVTTGTITFSPRRAAS